MFGLKWWPARWVERAQYPSTPLTAIGCSRVGSGCPTGRYGWVPRSSRRLLAPLIGSCGPTWTCDRTCFAGTPSYAIYLGEVLRSTGITPEQLPLRVRVLGAKQWTAEVVGPDGEPLDRHGE